MTKWGKGKEVRLHARECMAVEFKLYEEGIENINMGRNGEKVAGLEVLV